MCDLDPFSNIQSLHVATNFDMGCHMLCVFLPIANVEINFGEAPTGDMVCQTPPQCVMDEQLCGWSGMTITAREATTFRVIIGPSGGLRGYQYITGKV